MQGPEVQLTECRWAHACSAGSGRLRSAPRRTAPVTHRHRSGSLWAGSACLHSRHANELLVPNQRRTPAGGEAGATIFIPLYPFSYWPQPRLDQLLFHLSAELFADIQRLREKQGLQALSPHSQAPAPQRPCSLFPTLPGLCGPADGGRISSFSSSHGHDGEQPTPRVRVHLLPTGGRGTAARTRPPGLRPSALRTFVHQW